MPIVRFCRHAVVKIVSGAVVCSLCAVILAGAVIGKGSEHSEHLEHQHYAGPRSVIRLTVSGTTSTDSAVALTTSGVSVAARAQ